MRIKPPNHGKAVSKLGDMQGDVQSAIKHCRSVYELRQWSHEWNDLRILRALADLRDMDAFLPLPLLGMNDIQTFSEFTNANGITRNRLVKDDDDELVFNDASTLLGH